ncbi:CBO0543 family protein [Priestia koreensis]|uniref:CBO0543 family protein n=1 Tax=Priestia koreensis TaxID=284581 RepID=UPI003D085A27
MFEVVQQLKTQINNLELRYWYEQDVFSPHWWVVLIISALFVLLLCLLIDRQRVIFIWLVFFISFLLAGLVDEFGTYFGLWSYPHQFLIFTSRFNTVDFSIIPVTLTLVYQFFSKWSFFLIAHIIVSAIIGFIGVPLFVHFNLYQLNQWSYWNSFLTVLALGMIVKLISDAIDQYKHHKTY